MKIEATDKAERLAFFQELYEEARAETDGYYEKLTQHLEQYKGSKKLDGSDVEAEVVRNITYELVESQVTSYIPTPSVSPKMQSELNERLARVVETMLRNKRDELPFERMNDIDERYNPIYGGSVWLCEWDDSIRTHNTVGDVKISCLSPRHFVGQPHLFDVQEMEYLFITFETTKEDIVRRFDVELEVAEKTESEESDDDKTATLIVCYYKNDAGKVCEFVWSADTVLLDVEDYYQRKRRVCRACGEREGTCHCENPKLELQNEEFEELTRDVIRGFSEPIPAISPVFENGVLQTEMQKRQVMDEGEPVSFLDEMNILTPLMEDVKIPRTAPTRLPFYVPNVFPVVIRKNTSEEDALLGQSDCEFIRPQQQAINKVETRIHQKLMRSGVYPIVPEEYNGELDNTVYERVLRVSQGTKGLYDRLDLQVSIQQDIAQSERLYDHAKRILGISDTFQGQRDSSAQSGKAKELQIQQSAGRLDSKRQMKNAAYAELDAVIFQYYLAYADEPRPAVYRDAQGNLQNYTFNRYDFLVQDEAGEWYYNDQFLFRTDASVDVDRSREALWAENRQNFQSGAYGDPNSNRTRLIFWQNMERMHYPFAHDNVERLKEEVARDEQMAQMQQQMAAMQGEIDTRKEYEALLQEQAKGGQV
ncbi:MAG: hypothetical protein IKA46_02840 [Clostridia bacterium]|nr:hypothetical protein [Clostridia bacterium]